MTFGFLDFTTTTGVAISIAKAVQRGNKKINAVFIVSGLLFIAALILVVLGETKYLNDLYKTIGFVGGGISFMGFLGIYVYQLTLEESETKAEIQKVEDKIKENPNEATAAWELGRIKLESYLNRNLKQVRWIFFWTVIVMLAGFIILGYGIIKVYQDDKFINAGILTSVCGIIIEFIGATFLIIYKSTMQQAKDYVTVLERINAVGMSVQIIDSISKSESHLQDNSKADLAKKLIDLYGGLSK